MQALMQGLTQEPPVPIPPEIPAAAPSGLLLTAVALIIWAVIAWKHRLLKAFIAVVCSTFAGFLIGLVATPPYVNIGLAMIGSLAGLLVSTAVVALIRLALKALKPKQ